MSNLAKISISSGVFNKAFLSVAWDLRHSLSDYERRGFAQFMYLTLCGHIESILSKIIVSRLQVIKTNLNNNPLPIKYTTGSTTDLYDSKPYIDSVYSILNSTEEDVEKASYTNLCKLYKIVKLKSIKDTIGGELNKDLEAIFSLRNLFAHGRDLYISFNDNLLQSHTLDGNPLQNPALRLQKAGIIKEIKINGLNHDEFKSIFYSDVALFYFYEVTKQISSILIDSIQFPPEKFMVLHNDLPELEITES